MITKYIKTYWDWVESTFSKAWIVDHERYLSQASSAADLEYRINQLARRGLL